jgi:integrase
MKVTLEIRTSSKPRRYIKPNKKKEYPEGTTWVLRYSDPVSGQRRRDQIQAPSLGVALKRRAEKEVQLLSAVPATAPAQEEKVTLQDASELYFRNLESRGLDAKSIRVYRSAVDPFVQMCTKTYVQDVNKQDLLDFMGWLRRQPVAVRAHGNPQRTMFNKVGHVAIFLKTFGVSKLLKKSEYPRFHAKKVVAHTDEELALLYSEADDDERFLLDFMIGSMVRDAEAHNCRYSDLTGTTLTIRGKQHKTRTVEISPRLAASIQERRKRSDSEYLFPNRSGLPNQHLLRDLQDLAVQADAKFHTELHKLRKTGASRRYRAGSLLMTLMSELGHESLSTTQVYLSDVRMEETKKSVAAADYIPRLKIVRTGTDGD